MWAIGCTMFELIKGKPLFNAKHYLELIRMIIQKLGTPSPEDIEQIKSQPAIKFLNQQPFSKPKKISDEIENYPNSKALDLIDKCLTFNPKKRITAQEAMKHPYFADIFEEEHLKCEDHKMDFDFEEKENLSYEELKKMIIKEVVELNQEVGEEEECGDLLSI